MLEKKAEELRRMEAELERRLKMLPAKMEAKKARTKARLKIQAQTAAPAISLNGARPRVARPIEKRRPLPARELQNARIKSLVLLLILATLVILLWRAIP
jgi:hypothetical protein